MTSPEFARPIINLHRRVVEYLGRDVWHAFDPIPSQAMEIGGLLLGTTVPESGVIEIEDFEPLTWNRRSERFVLSESECVALQNTLTACAWLREGKRRVVGCYRTHIGEGFSLTANDLAFARSCL